MSVVIFSVLLSIGVIMLADLFYDLSDKEVVAAVCGAILPMIILSVFSGSPIVFITGVFALLITARRARWYR